MNVYRQVVIEQGTHDVTLSWDEARKLREWLLDKVGGAPAVEAVEAPKVGKETS